MDRIGKLLIVEDDESLCQYLKDHLEDFFEIEIRHDGQAGYEIATSFKPDLIISDVRMPRLSGLNMLRQIRRTPGMAYVRVILLTVLKSDEDRIRGYENLADLYFTKPFNIAELTAAAIGLVRLYKHRVAEHEPEEETEPVIAGLTDDDREFLDHLSSAVQDRLSDHHLTVEEVAQAVHISRRQLERRLKELEGITPGEYIRQVRLEVAKQLLEAGRASSLKTLANSVGFLDVRTFVTRFTSQFGFAPKIQ